MAIVGMATASKRKWVYRDLGWSVDRNTHEIGVLESGDLEAHVSDFVISNKINVENCTRSERETHSDSADLEVE